MKKEIVTPESMQIICNIQRMNEKINPSYNWIKDRKRMYKMTFDELFEEQCNLIAEYNKAVKK